MQQREELLNGLDEPLVSILMPAYNAVKHIREAVESILNQTYTNFELLICNDGSTDSTLSLLESFRDSRIKIFNNAHNIGELKTRNLLLNKAEGEFIAYQDADDWSSPDRIEKQVNELINKDIGLVGCQAIYVDSNGDFIRISKHPTSYGEVLVKIYKQNVFGGALVMFRREIIDQIGYYRLYFDRLAFFDYDFIFRIAEKYKCYNLPEGLYYYRQIKESASKEINVNKHLAFYIVQYLANQRKLYHYDDLERGGREKVDAYFEELKKTYFTDPSLIYREYSTKFMYNKLYYSAITSSWKGVILRPNKVVNWRTFQYCVRKSFIAGIKAALNFKYLCF